MKNKMLFLIFGLALCVASFGQIDPTANSQTTTGMIKVTILYPNDEGKMFDMDYYANKHMPMLAELFGDTLKKLEIDKGMSGRTADDPTPYLAIGHLYFDSIEAYQNAFGPNAAKIR